MDKTSHCRVADGREVATGPGISRDSIGEL